MTKEVELLRTRLKQRSEELDRREKELKAEAQRLRNDLNEARSMLGQNDAALPCFWQYNEFIDQLKTFQSAASSDALDVLVDQPAGEELFALFADGDKLAKQH